MISWEYKSTSVSVISKNGGREYGYKLAANESMPKMKNQSVSISDDFTGADKEKKQTHYTEALGPLALHQVTEKSRQSEELRH